MVFAERNHSSEVSQVFQRTSKFVFKSDTANATTLIVKKHLIMSLIQKVLKTTKVRKDKEKSPPENS